MAGFERAHVDGLICRDSPTTADPDVVWPIVAAEETPSAVLEARARMADAIKNERNTTTV